MRQNRILLPFVALVICASSGGFLACSADGASGADPILDASLDDPSAPDTSLPESSARDAGADQTVPRDSGVDTGTGARDAASDTQAEAAAVVDASDGGVSDAGPSVPDSARPVVDAGFDPAGSACNPPNATQERTCGRCGIERRLCRGSDAGATWLEWGVCSGEKPDGGYPNTQVPMDCAMCGTKTISYDGQCIASVSSCQPAPGAQCEKGTSEWAAGLSCAGGTGRYRTCNSGCMWEPFGDCTTFMNPNKVTIASVADAGSNVVATTFQYFANPKIGRLLGSTVVACPLTGSGYPQTEQSAYAYVEVRNPTAQRAVVSLWHSSGDTQMAVYEGSAPPTDDAARRSCLPGTNATDSCPTELAAQCKGTGQTSVAGVAAVPIPPNSSITVYNALYSTTTSSGSFQLNVRTDSLQ